MFLSTFLNNELIIRSPFENVTDTVLIEGKSVAFKMKPVGLAPIQSNLDYLENELLLRVGTQGGVAGPGCHFSCKSCDAASRPGKNLTAEQIKYQVYHMLLSEYGNMEAGKKIHIATYGTGEPFMNQNVLLAYEAIAAELPHTAFTVSTSGPKHNLTEKFFEELIRLANAGLDLNLQISVNSLDQQVRRLYMGDIDGKISLSLPELVDYVFWWKFRTGHLAILNFVVGPDFIRPWSVQDYNELLRLFPPNDAIIKLSLESYYGGKTWDFKRYVKEMETRKKRVEQLGYRCIIFYLPASNVQGGGCGSIAPTNNLIKIR